MPTTTLDPLLPQRLRDAVVVRAGERRVAAAARRAFDILDEDLNEGAE